MPSPAPGLWGSRAKQNPLFTGDEDAAQRRSAVRGPGGPGELPQRSKAAFGSAGSARGRQACIFSKRVITFSQTGPSRSKVPGPGSSFRICFLRAWRCAEGRDGASGRAGGGQDGNLGKAERVREDSAAAPSTCPRPTHSSDGARNVFASQVFQPGLRLQTGGRGQHAVSELCSGGWAWSDVEAISSLNFNIC